MVTKDLKPQYNHDEEKVKKPRIRNKKISEEPSVSESVF